MKGASRWLDASATAVAPSAHIPTAAPSAVRLPSLMLSPFRLQRLEHAHHASGLESERRIVGGPGEREQRAPAHGERAVAYRAPEQALGAIAAAARRVLGVVLAHDDAEPHRRAPGQAEARRDRS